MPSRRKLNRTIYRRKSNRYKCRTRELTQRWPIRKRRDDNIPLNETINRWLLNATWHTRNLMQIFNAHQTLNGINFRRNIARSLSDCKYNDIVSSRRCKCCSQREPHYLLPPYSSRYRCIWAPYLHRFLRGQWPMAMKTACIGTLHPETCTINCSTIIIQLITHIFNHH